MSPANAENLIAAISPMSGLSLGFPDFTTLIATPDGSVSSAKAGRLTPATEVAAATIPKVATSRRNSVLDFCADNCTEFERETGGVGATNADVEGINLFRAKPESNAPIIASIPAASAKKIQLKFENKANKDLRIYLDENKVKKMKNEKKK